MEAADRAHRGARGEDVDELWDEVGEHRAFLEEGGGLEERRRRNLAGEVFAVASSRAKASRERGRRRPRAAAAARRGAAPRARPADGGARDHREGLPNWRRKRLRRSLTSRRRASASPAIARVTPVYGSETLSRLAGREVWLKAENLQRTGSFKVRGAVNRIATLAAGERAAGVVAASAGNHGQAVAWAAREAGVRATIYVPQDAPMAKVEARQNYGARARARRRPASRMRSRRRARTSRRPARRSSTVRGRAVIAGQGTIGLELAEQVRGRDGRHPGRRRRARGGDRDGAARAEAGRAHRRRPGRQATGYTIADGIFVKQPGELTMRDPRRAARRHRSHVERRGDQRGDRAAARADEARRRGRGRGRRRGAARGEGRRRRAGGDGPLRREHRPDAAHLGDAARPHASPAATSSCARASPTGPAS